MVLNQPKGFVLQQLIEVNGNQASPYEFKAPLYIFEQCVLFKNACLATSAMLG